jgi:aspartate carbamoyltransferase catalytic subunit
VTKALEHVAQKRDGKGAGSIRPHQSRSGNDGAWKGRGLLGLQGVPPADLRLLVARAHQLQPTANLTDTRTGQLAGRTIATLFFEDSTRTKTSFTLAARRMSADVVDLSTGASSVNKGETLIDTARTVEAMGVSAMVVRAKQGGAAGLVAGAVKCPIINAGDGKHEHPTQGLLDALTIAESHNRTDHFDFAGLTIAIVGDVASSRVARSGIAAFTTLGAKVVCVGPPSFAPGSLESLGCAVSNDLDSVLPAADAIMMLRIQFERHGGEGDSKTATTGPGGVKVTSIASLREYRELYGMTEDRAARIKSGAIIMHPGPMNRGLEIDPAVADGPRSVVFRQVANGVAVRMAVLGLILGD